MILSYSEHRETSVCVKYELKRQGEDVYGLSEAAQDTLYKKYQPAVDKTEADHKAWVKEAQILVEKYWRQKH
jgi:hypothetical protein